MALKRINKVRDSSFFYRFRLEFQAKLILNFNKEEILTLFVYILKVTYFYLKT